jgi:hypothetical protein
VRLDYISDFDDNGLMYFLGTQGTQFTCFTGTKVQILTPKPRPRLSARKGAHKRTKPPYLLTGTKVQILTPPRTQGRTQAYQNPAKIGQLAVSSSEGKGKQNFYAVVGRERAGCAIYYKTVSWFAIDIGKGRSLSPTAYTGCIFFPPFFISSIRGREVGLT